MSSNAFSGVGTQFKRATTESSGSGFAALAEVNSIVGPNKTRTTIDVTSLDSVGGYREFIPSFRDGGEITLGMNFTPDTYDLVNEDFEDEDKRQYQIVLGNVAATTFEFWAYVTNLSSAVPLDDKVTADVTVKVTGPVEMSS